MDFGTDTEGSGLRKIHSKHPDRIHRKFYVGTTRTKEKLFILRNLTNYYYTIGEQISNE